MNRVLLAALGAVLSVAGWSLDLSPQVGEAVRLELEGRLGEALDRYKVALSTDPTLVSDETASQPITVFALSKAAHLSLDLGYGEEAWDLGGRLWASPNGPAVAAGTLVRMRTLRLQGRGTEALALYDQFRRSWPKEPPGVALEAEVGRLRPPAHPRRGPGLWAQSGAWTVLPTAVEVYGLQVLEASRIQVGAFREWGHALTLIDMLREKGWVPFTDTRTQPTGEKLYLVYLVSRQPDSDLARLKAQGLTSLP